MTRMVTRAWLVTAAVALLGSYAAAQQTDTSFFAGLYTTPVAHKVGDILTVIVAESTQATHQATREHAKKAQAKAGPGEGTLKFIPLLGYGGSSTSSAKASSARQETLYTRLSARVVGITAGGNLRIEGQREIVVNQDLQRLTISGEVRPQDIRADNTVYSQDLINAHISYRGSDPGRPGKRVGIITRLLNWLF